MTATAIVRGTGALARVLGSIALFLAPAVAHAGIPLVTPPERARILNFDDVENAPTAFSNANPVRERFEALGIDFSAPGNDGGTVLQSNGSSGISGISPPNALFFNTAATMENGGKPRLPQDLLFRQPVRYVQFNVGDASGTTITAEAFNTDSDSVDLVNIVPTTAMQTVILEGRHISKVVLSGGGGAQVVDDIAFVLDTTIVNFDERPYPASFAAATALRREYVGVGFESVSSTNSNTVDGGAVLNETSGIAVTGFSAPNFFAIDNSASMSSGGTAKFPVYLQFFPPIRYARFLVADPDGATVTAKGSYFGGPPVYEVETPVTAAMTPVEIHGDPMTFIEITSTGTRLVLDDVEFETAGTKIDFDDYTNSPTLLGETTAIRDRYKGLGVRFKAPGNDGPAIVGFVNPFGSITGLSGTNFLGFDAGELLGNGASANLPMTIEFDRPMKRVDLFVGSNQGTRIFVQATDAVGGLNASTDLITTANMQVLFLYYDGIKKLEVTAQGNAGVIDNLTFEPTDECAFNICYQGETLDYYCSDCVTEICAQDSNCCNDGWTENCAILAEANCGLTCGPLCGDANIDRKISATDALAALRTAVGSASCPGFRCNFNGTGGVTSGDALLILKTSVGQETDPNCPPEPV
jgi:hypothetical protein